jgi:hypothetical protein
VLAQYGVPIVRETLIAEDAIDDIDVAGLTFPLAVKIESLDIAHKTEAGAVRLGIADRAALKEAARQVIAAARRHHPQARIDGVLAQEMAHGTEVIVGALDDPHFGPVVMVGLGGILTEILHDVTHRFAPFDRTVAQEMLSELKGAALRRRAGAHRLAHSRPCGPHPRDRHQSVVRASGGPRGGRSRCAGGVVLT